MPFTVEEFRDLIRLLEERPEWRAELRHLLLTDELLSMPEQLAVSRLETDRRFQELATQVAALTQEHRQFAQGQIQLTQQMAELTRRVDDLTQQMAELARRVDDLTQQMAELTRRVDDLTQQMAELTRRVDDLTQQMAELTRRVDDLTQQMAELTRRVDDLTRQVADLTLQVATLTRIVQTLVVDVAELKGDSLERRYRERAPAYFARLIRRIRVLTVEELAALLDEAVTRGTLSEAEAEDVTWADLVVRGRRREDGTEVYLVVEISWGVAPQDVERAAHRAALLTRVGMLALPVVAGKTITDEANRLAQARQVWQLTDGQTILPPTTEHS